MNNELTLDRVYKASYVLNDVVRTTDLLPAPKIKPGVELYLKTENLHIRAELAAKDINYREKFDYVTARAVAKLNTLSEYCIPLIKKGGLFISYKGELDEEKESLNAINILGGKIVQKEEYNLPKDMGKRRLYIIEKIKNTPLKYPRGNGKERSNPL